MPLSNLLVVVAGCLVQRHRAKILDWVPGRFLVDVWVDFLAILIAFWEAEGMKILIWR